MHDTTHKIELSDAPSFKQELRLLLTLAIPTVGAKLSHMALGFTDFVFVSKMGTEATAAISPATIFCFIVLCMGMGCVSSIQTFAAQALGRREPHRAAAYVWQSFYVGFFFLLLTWPAIQMMRPFWTFVGHPENVREMEIAFCEIDLWSMGLAIICVGLESFFNGIQRPAVALWSVAVAIAFNALGDYVLIFGHWGFPAMGIKGSALATVLAWGVRIGIMLTAFLSLKYESTFHTRRNWRFNASKLWEILRMGGPIGVQWFLDVTSWFVFIGLIMAKLGTETLAAANIAIQLMHMSFMPAIGIGTAVASLVGHAIGAKKLALAQRHGRDGMVVTMIYMGAIGLIYWLGRYFLMGLLSSDSVVIEIGAGILLWAAVFQVFDAMGINYISALRGAGDTKWPMIYVIFYCWVVFIGGCLLAIRYAPGLGYHGPWMMCTLYIILLGLTLWVRWRRGEWQRIDLFKKKDEMAGTEHAPGVPLLSADAE